MAWQKDYRNMRNYEVSHSTQPDSPGMFGVVDELLVARASGNKELQEKIEKGESPRYSPTLFNSRGKHTKKREREIALSWRNAEEANKKWKETLKPHNPIGNVKDDTLLETDSHNLDST
jgi:hypothetical protein